MAPDTRKHVIVEELPGGREVAVREPLPWQLRLRRDPFAMSVFSPSQLPQALAARLEFVSMLLEGAPIVDEDGNDTGERTGPLISKDLAAKLLKRAA